MAAMESQGRDIKMDERRVEGYRNFATKLWNAARFCQANGIGASATVAAPEATLAVNKWIIGEVVETLAKLDKAFAEFRFDAMADAIYQFTWGTFCDWYLELIKPVLSPNPPRSRGGGDGEAGDGGGDPEAPLSDTPLHRSAVPLPINGEDLEATETRAVAGWVLDQILVMLHPFMPFITEELWDKMGDRGGNLLIHAAWPELERIRFSHPSYNSPEYRDVSAIRSLIGVIKAIRSARAQYDIPYTQPLDVVLYSMVGTNIAAGLRAVISFNDQLKRQVNAEIIRVAQGEVSLTEPHIAVSVPLGGLLLPLGDDIDVPELRRRMTATRDLCQKEATSLSARLNNPAFVEKAKPEAVEKARADHAEKAAEIERLQAALARLG
jgi:valyl-tRNA synthetase